MRKYLFMTSDDIEHSSRVIDFADYFICAGYDDGREKRKEEK
jgi:hypothetical protein